MPARLARHVPVGVRWLVSPPAVGRGLGLPWFKAVLEHLRVETPHPPILALARCGAWPADAHTALNMGFAVVQVAPQLPAVPALRGLAQALRDPATGLPVLWEDRATDLDP